MGVSRRAAPVDSSFVPLNLKSLQIQAAEPPRVSFVELHCPLFEPSRCPCDQVVRLRRIVSKQNTMNTGTPRPVRSHHWPSSHKVQGLHAFQFSSVHWYLMTPDIRPVVLKVGSSGRLYLHYWGRLCFGLVLVSRQGFSV